jgi:hypothetical protein
MKKILTLLILLSISLPSYAINVCRCNPEATKFESKYKRAYAIFTGEVVNIQRQINPDRQKITFKVMESWRGAKHPNISVYSQGIDAAATLREGLTCGFPFRNGEKYLIYSFRNKNVNGPSWTTKCGGVIPLAQAKKELDLLSDKPKIEIEK